jgi:hypothetical protein
LPSQAILGTCPSVDGSVGNGGVDLTGNAGAPGSGTGSGAPGDPGTPVDPGTVIRDEYTVTEPLTISDLAHFRPDPGIDHMQPNGWMVVGLPTNFYAEVGPQIHDGTLLGQPASVRFTPVTWYWTYGDGHSATRATKGNTWAALGKREFDETPTSHIYRSTGTYFIDLDIDFAAEYRFAGGPWVPVIGVVRVPANRLVATAGDAKTVLVQHDCAANPSGPGC